MRIRNGVPFFVAALLTLTCPIAANAQQSKPAPQPNAKSTTVDDILVHPKATLPECLDCTQNLQLWRSKGCTPGSCTADCQDIVNLMSECRANCSTAVPQC